MATMEERMGTIETWKRRADLDLYGVPGSPDIGLVREHRENQAEHRGQLKIFKIFVAVVGVGQVVVTILITLQKLGIIK